MKVFQGNQVYYMDYDPNATKDVTLLNKKIKNKNNRSYFTCMGVLPTCVFKHHMHAWYPQRPEEGV